MTGPLGDLHKRLDRCRQAAAYAVREAARVRDARARQSYELLAEGWTGLADDLERRLNGDSEKNEH